MPWRFSTLRRTAAASLLICALATAQSADRGQPDGDPAPIAPAGGSHSAWQFPLDKLNRQLPRWLRLSGGYRARAERPSGIRFAGARDAYVLSRLRLDLEIRPAGWLLLFAEGQDTRVAFNHRIPNNMPYQDTWDLRQAYVQIGSTREGWVDLIAGRQVLSFGNERIIGPSDWTNQGRTFDAVRLDLHQDRYRLSLIAASVVVGRDGVIDHHNQGNDLYGAYASLQRLVPGATLEPYVFWRLAPATMPLPETARRGHLDEVTPGVRLAGGLPAHFDYELEMDLQRGSLGPDSIRSWAGTWNLGRTFPGLPGSPRLFAEANYASGNRNPGGTTWSTFDQIYPSGHNKLDFADQVGRRNVEQVRAGAREAAGRRCRLNETYEDIWLATAHDALYASSGVVAVAADPAAPSRHVGQEVDFWADCEISRGLTGGLGYARLFAGGFLKAASPGKDYSYPFLYLTYRFAAK